MERLAALYLAVLVGTPTRYSVTLEEFLQLIKLTNRTYRYTLSCIVSFL